MAYTNKLPNDRDTLLRLDRQHTRTEIANMYGVTRTAVSLAMDRHKIPRSESGRGGTRVVYREEIPWRVAVDHAMDYAHRQLQAYGAEQAGRPLSADRKVALEKFKAEMDNLKAVVAYTREDGFYLVKRRKSDKGYTRQPDKSDRK